MSTELSLVFSKIDPFRAAKSSTETVKYGTAGFRSHADGLDFVVYRMGLLATLRSKSLGGKVIGLMITASHNPEQDNGVKLVDPMGEMLEASWEVIASRVANADYADLAVVLEDIVKSLNIDWQTNSTVFIGRDTRPTSPSFSEGAKSAIEAIRGGVVDCGIVTTPMLHFFVAEANSKRSLVPPTNEDYYMKFANAFKSLNNSPNTGNYTPAIYFDGANGVGAVAMQALSGYLDGSLKVDIFNSGTGRLNYMCGSDFIKVNKRAPDGVPIETEVRSVAVDGDADRLIYFYLDQTREIHVLDGDRIATLLAEYLMDLIKASGVDVKLGIVQTAYANGASSNYIQQVLKVPLAFTETGVKHLHHKALEYDVGVYFEANGHGTIVYSERAKKIIEAATENTASSEDARSAAKKLWGMIALTNEAVGDALSDMLLVETVLRAKGWGAADWERTYTDLPNRLLKVTIENRDVVTTTDAARRCLTPVGLQEQIDNFVKEYANGRAFVRASGTEDVVRIYSEAATQAKADELGAKVALAVFNTANGVGDPPVVPS